MALVLKIDGIPLRLRVLGLRLVWCKGWARTTWLCMTPMLIVDQRLGEDDMALPLTVERSYVFSSASLRMLTLVAACGL